jgi:hypothetical protein
MEICRDFKELLVLLNANSVEYVIIGGYALAHHGAPRYTRDIDIYVRPTPTNSVRIMTALDAFGFHPTDLTAEDFQKPSQVVQIGYPPIRVDLITSIGGVTWEQADAGKSLGHYDDVSVPYLGKSELLASKAAAGRPKDLADIEALRRGHRKE